MADQRLAPIKHGFGTLQKLYLPLRDLRGADIELGGQLSQRLLATHRF
jgi:hypothetical protein